MYRPVKDVVNFPKVEEKKAEGEDKNDFGRSRP
jgi:hypothetical protein